MYFASYLIRDRFITYGEGLGGKNLLQDKNFVRTPLPGLKNGKWTPLLINNSF